jgi:peptidyl-prolyl cis-trans isomerase SurA
MTPSNPRLALAILLVGFTTASSWVSAQQPLTPPLLSRPTRPTGPIEVDGIAAKVNGKVITRNEVSFMLSPRYAQLVAQYPRRGPQFETEFKAAKQAIIQELIDREIIMDEFKQLGASIKPYVIEEEIKRQISELYNGDEAKFRDELKRNRLTMEGYRVMTHDKLIVQAMRSRQFSDAPPALPDEIRKEYNEVKKTLRDVTKDKISFEKIFIPSSDPANPSATPDSQLALAESLVKKLNDGKNFAELAKENSKDAFADKGGVQENVARTDLSPEFAAIIFDAPVGKLIGPLMDPQGFTIVKASKIDFGPPPPLDDKLRTIIADRVHKKKTSAQYERWIISKRKKAMIYIRPS